MYSVSITSKLKEKNKTRKTMEPRNVQSILEKGRFFAALYSILAAVPIASRGSIFKGILKGRKIA